MTRWITPELRQIVAARANFLCEYCLVGEPDSFYGCEVDHIISLKHGGLTDVGNLAYACALCNRNKGSDIGSISPRVSSLASSIRARIVGQNILFWSKRLFDR